MELKYGLTGSKRKELAKAIGELLNEDVRYLGVPSMAYSIGGFTLTKEGNLVFDENLVESAELVLRLKEKGFVPLEEIENIQEPAPQSDTAGTQAERNVLTISVALMEEAELNRLKNLVKSKKTLLSHAFKSEEIEVVVEEDRISFPWFELSDSDHFDAYSQFVIKLCKLAKELSRAITKEKIMENEKYAFRCFLLRLGFIGDEYKKTRKILLENLEGSSAFRVKKEVVNDEISNRCRA